jgi:hypothetical protein
MKKVIPFVLVLLSVSALVVLASRPVAGQAPASRLVMFGDMVLFSGNGQPRNCFAMNRFKPGEPVGFRVTVVDSASGQPAADAEVVVQLTYGGKTEDVPARYRGTGRGNLTPNLWSAKWTVPAGAPTGVVGVKVIAKDKSGRSAEWTPFPNQASHLTIVNE